MTSQTSTKPSVPLLESDEYHQFILQRPAEILMVLREMCDSAAQITVFFNAGRDMLLTKPLACGSDYLLLDCGPDEFVNRRATQATEFNCVTFPSRIRVQFALQSLELVEQAGHFAFRAALPGHILRLQRREHYRLATSSTRPLKCLIPMPLPDDGVHLHIGHLFDISGGGMGITAPADEMPFAVGMEFPNCRVDLPEVGVVTCA
jgi:c-di-GMP-binding flagellar brake protein YcgR